MTIAVTFGALHRVGYSDPTISSGAPGSGDPAINLAGSTLLVVALQMGGTPPDLALTTLSFGGQALTRVIGSDFAGAYGTHHAVWYLVNPPSGAQSFTMGGLTGFTAGWILAQVVGVTGADLTAPVGAIAHASSNENWVNNLDVALDDSEASGSILMSFIKHMFGPTTYATPTGGWSELIPSGDLQSGGFDAQQKNPSGTTGDQALNFAGSGSVPYDANVIEILPAPTQTLTMEVDDEPSIDFIMGDGVVGWPQFADLAAPITVNLSVGDGTINHVLSLIGEGPTALFTVGGGKLVYDQVLSGVGAVAEFSVGGGGAETWQTITGQGPVAKFSFGTGGVTKHPHYPLVLAPGESIDLKVAFIPNHAGIQTGTLSINSNAPNSPNIVNLTGRGLGTGAQNLSGQGASVKFVFGSGTVSVGGETPNITYLTADGSKLRDEADNQVMLRSVNWYGFEQAYIPGGSWNRPYKTITVDGVVEEGMMDQMKRLGFNSIRLLINQDIVKSGVNMNTVTGVGAVYCSPVFNTDLFNNPDNLPPWNIPQANIKDAIVILDKIVDHAEELGMRLIFDMHTFAADTDNFLATGGKWYSTTNPGDTGSSSLMMRSPRSEEQAIVAWEAYASRYAGRAVVCAFDLINEPWACTWDDNPNTGLPAYYERAAARIHALNPDVMIICEGVTGNVNHCPEGFETEYENTHGFYEWGTIWSGKLDGAVSRPVELEIPNKVIYSPHEYGSHTLGGPLSGNVDHQWFNPEAQMPFYAGLPFPDNMFEVWRRQWGMLAEDNIAPVWIGEMGSTLSVGGQDWFTVGVGGAITHNIFEPDYAQKHYDLDTAWLKKLSDYCNKFDIGTAWWSFNPGTVGGIVQQDWKTTLLSKYNHIRDAFVYPNGPFTAPVIKQTSPYFHTSGNQIVDSLGNNVRFKACSWYGFETAQYMPQGLWQLRYTDILTQIKGWGFDTIRFPFSGDILTHATHADMSTNNQVDLGPLTPIQMLDKLIDTCDAMDLKVHLVMYGHVTGGFGGPPITGPYDANWFKDFWTAIATRYLTKTNVMAIDIFEEPTIQWADWRALNAEVANAVHEVNPGLLIHMQGSSPPPGTFDYFAAEYLVPVATDPLVLTVPNRVVYGPHVYGQSVYPMSYMQTSTPSAPVTGWPNNLYAHFRSAYGYIFENNIAPVWLTEFGGKMGIDSAGAVVVNGPEETAWMQAVVKYINGDFNGDGTRDLAEGKKGMSFSYWNWSAYSGGTDGLVRYDLTTPQTHKLTLLAPLLTDED